MPNSFPINFSGSPLYTVMLMVAALSAFIMLNVFMKKGGFSKFVKKRIRRSLGYSAILACIFSNMANWCFHREILSLSVFDRFTKGGTAFIVWIICFIGFSALFLRLYKLDLKRCLDIIAPPLLLATAIARIGCLFAGCCYGAEISLGDNIVHFPIRETEAVFSFILSIILCCKFKGKRLSVYLIAYPAFRFFAEFLRGDDRGSLFNISVLSPTQIISALIVITTATVLIINAVKRSKAKKNIEAIKAQEIKADPSHNTDILDTSTEGQTGAECEITQTEQKNEPSDTASDTAAPQVQEKKVQKKQKKKYTPRPVDFNDPSIKSNPLRIILTVIAVIAAIVALFIMNNPFGLGWVSNADYYIRDSLGFIFDSGAFSNEIGYTDGNSALDVSGCDEVKNGNEALELIRSHSTWSDHSYTAFSTRTLTGGYKAYTFVRTENGLPIFGRSSSLIVDSDDRPLFIINDEANDTFTNDTVGQYAVTDTTYKKYVAETDEIVNRTECLYDVGTGLLRAELLQIKGSNGSSYGILIEPKNETVIKLLSDASVLSHNVRADVIIDAAEKAEALISEDETEMIKQLSSKKAKTLELEYLSTAMQGAIGRSYIKSKLSSEDFSAALRMTIEIAYTVPDLNEQLFCDILSKTVEQTAKDNGISDSDAEKLGKTVKSSFKSSGIKQTKDEKTVQLDVNKRKTVIKNTIGCASDVDTVKLHMPENSYMKLEISGKVSVDIEVYSESGNHIVTTYSSSAQEITLYPSDGTDYVLKIKSSDAQLVSWSGEGSYKISAYSEEDDGQTPFYVNTTLYGISAAFSTSKSSVFGLIFYGDAAYSGDEYMALCMLPSLDGCYTMSNSCAGGEFQLTDHVKEEILRKLLVSEDMIDGVTIAPDTVMEISCFRFINVENGTLVKARINVTDAAGNSRQGYSFFKLELVTDIEEFDTNVESPIWTKEELETLSAIFNAIFSNKYYITELNTEELLSSFGDTFDNISEEGGMPSLYDFWTTTPGEFAFVKEFDRQAALNAGYSEERVDEFERFTLRHNAAYFDKMCENITLIHDSLELYSAGIISGMKLYDFIDDPIGALIDSSTDDMTVKSCYRIGKIVWGVFTGDIKDIAEAVSDVAFEDYVKMGVKSYAEQLELDAKQLESQKFKIEMAAAEYRARAEQTDKKYFWEYIF